MMVLWNMYALNAKLVARLTGQVGEVHIMGGHERNGYQ